MWILLVFLNFLCWVLNIFGVPGNWLMLFLTTAYAYWGPREAPADIGWKILVLLTVLALIGEAVEFLAGAAGAKKLGGSKRSAALALVGSLVGAIVGIIVAIPIPILGQIIGALLFASAGALIGSLLGELWKGRQFEQSWAIGKAAFWGRLLGTLGKIIVGAVMFGVALAALFL